MTLGEMSDAAWIIETRGKQIGFLTPEELQRRREGRNTPPASAVGF
jgi:hypothetical protein